MTALVGLSGLILSFLIGVCLGATAVEDVEGELRLPSGWWILPSAVMAGLLAAAALIWAGV